MKHKSLLAFALTFIITTSLGNTLPLPDSLTALNSTTGQHTLIDSHYKRDYWPLSQYFVTEHGLTYCAPASIAMVLNSMNIEPPLTPEHAPYAMFTQNNLFNSHAIVDIITPTKIKHQGLTLDQAATILKAFNLKVTTVHADEANIKNFTDELKTALKKKHSFVIVNFSRKGIKQKGGGHFSPIAAYNDTTQQALILDVARYKYPPAWVDTETLLGAMQTTDSTSELSRGYLIITKKNTMNDV